MKPRHHLRKYLPQIVKCRAQLLLKVRTGQMNLTRAPERFQRGRDTTINSLFFPLGKLRILRVNQLLVDSTVTLTHGRAFRLRRVCR